MQVRHTLNQKLKRLEPLDTLCYYCEAEQSESMDDNCFIPIYIEDDRTNIVVYRSVKYKKIDVGIPRCAKCIKIHESAAETAQLIIPSIAVAIVVISFLIWGQWGIVSLLPGALIGFLGIPILENILVRKKGIFTKKDGAERSDTIQELVLQGWTLNKPSA